MKILISILLFIIIKCTLAFEPSENFDRDVILDSKSLNGQYRLFWKIVGDEIIFEAHVATLGWLGLGFSPTGGMTGSDIVVGGVKNGQPYIYDRHATATTLPLMDTQQDYQSLYGAENATHTVLKFKRKLATCDPDDWQITNDTVKLIWSFNPTDVENENQFSMHTQRGTRSIMLLEPSKSSRGRMPLDVFTFDVNVTNVQIPSDYHTMYICKIIKLPERPKAHIVKYEPVIKSGNEPYVHHILIYHCLYDMSEFVDKQEECFSRDHSMTSEMYKCTSRYLAGWAVGAEAVVYEDNLGYPFFEKETSPYMLLEVHYDNSKYIQGLTDNSGLRLYLTNQLRPVEIGSIIFGMDATANAMVLPPGQNVLTLKMFCDSTCTKHLPSEGLHFFGGFLHEHLHGKALRLRHLRNGVELPPIMEDNFYDFNYQEQRTVNPARLVLPDDTLIVECDFTTENDKNTTFGGFTTKDEMCLIFIDYYPKINGLVGCFGAPMRSTYAEAMGATYDTKNKSVVSDLGVFPSIKQYFSAVNWKDDDIFVDKSLPRTPKGQIFQDGINNGLYRQYCLLKDNSETTTEASTNNTDEKLLEKVSSEWSDSLKFPRPTVPYTKPDACRSQRNSLPQTHTKHTTAPTQNFQGYNGEQYSNHDILDPRGYYHLFWRYDEATVTFEIHVKAQGWVALGFSPSGGMAGADIVHAFINNNGAAELTDRFSSSSKFPEQDVQQDYNLVHGIKNGTHIVVSFSRKKVTFDSQDIPLTDNIMRIIYAWSDVMPENKNQFVKHESDSRGMKSLKLFSNPVVVKPLSNDVKVFDILMNNGSMSTVPPFNVISSSSIMDSFTQKPIRGISPKMAVSTAIKILLVVKIFM